MKSPSLKVLAVIPARLGSTRLPRKPLIEVAGKPIIQHVYDNLSSPLIAKKIVATDSEEILDTVKSFGGEVILTSPHHENGTERCLEVVSKLNHDYQLILNIQGDEPLVGADIVDNLIAPFLKNPQLKMSSLKQKITSTEAINNPNVVKVVCDEYGYALYFSRSTIPFNRDDLPNVTYYKHLGFYAFTPDFLKEYVNTPPSWLEQVEKLEQLRALAGGHKIHLNEINRDLVDINTPEDLQKFEDYLLNH